MVLSCDEGVGRQCIDGRVKLLWVKTELKLMLKRLALSSGSLVVLYSSFSMQGIKDEHLRWCEYR